MAYIDDASSPVFARFYAYEGTLPAMGRFRRFIQQHGILPAIYAENIRPASRRPSRR